MRAWAEGRSPGGVGLRSREEGSHVVLLDGATVLMSSSAPATRALLEARGLRVVAVDVTEFHELEGCVTCLSVRLRG